MGSARICPRDKKVLREAVLGSATVEICGACAGTFFDAEDLIAAGGVVADPSTWDRAETGGAVKPSTLACPGCAATMDAQDVTHDGKHVEVDRCGKCRGIWLDKGELDTLLAIGSALESVIESERAKARAELLALEQSGGADFRKASPSGRRTLLLVGIAVLIVAAVGGGIYQYEASKLLPRPSEGGTGTRAKGEEGCPCGCDHSAAMAAELRRKEDADALAGIQATLTTIGTREEAGYITERMVQHRLRMLDLAGEIAERRPELTAPFWSTSSSSRCASERVEGRGLRLCAELAVHGERFEIVRGAEKLITSSFRLWLEIENLRSEPRTLALPAIDGVRFPIARWYREGTAGLPFDGVVGAGERVRVNVIGDIPEHVLPGAPIDATVRVDTVAVHVKTEARADIHVGQR